jgi:heterodisulfide reductase subunit A2
MAKIWASQKVRHSSNSIRMNKLVAVIGGGPAGLECASALAKMGINVKLYERDVETGGHLQNWNELFPDRRKSSEVLQLLRSNASDRIDLKTNTSVKSIERSNGSFQIHTLEDKADITDAVIIATGFDLFDSRRKEEYGFGIYENVITSADLEKMFSSKEKLRTSDGRVPKRVGFVHCVGSRDEKVGNLHCSKVCCVTAVKQAIEIRELLPETETFCFYMDLRMYGRHFEELYKEAQEKWNVNFIRGRLSEAAEDQDGSIIVKVEDTLTGRPLKINVNLLVLMAGMQPSASKPVFTSEIPFNHCDDGFLKSVDEHVGANLSGIDGVFYAGTCTGPKSIAETLADARSAALAVAAFLDVITN